MYITYARYAKRTSLRNFFVTLAVLLICNVALAHDGETHGDDSKVATASSSSPWGKNYFPNTILITQDGEKVKFFDDLIKDKVVAINFIFTSCGNTCPL